MTQIERLLGIMRRLRDPENGCPWDKEQTLPPSRRIPLKKPMKCSTLSPAKILTICAVSWATCCSSRLLRSDGAGRGRFDFNDICAAISDKLERRHPHIFGEASAGSSSEVLARWEQIKALSERKVPALRAGRHPA